MSSCLSLPIPHSTLFYDGGDVGGGGAEGAGGGEFDGTHGGGETAAFVDAAAFGAFVEVACHIGVAASGGIHYVGRGVCRDFMEDSVGIDERPLVAEG